MPNEKTRTDQFVRRQLEAAGLHYEEQGSSFPQIKVALKNASKSGKGQGKPEFILVYNSVITTNNKPVIVIIEDKLSNQFLINFKENGELNLVSGPNSPVSCYAVNGAVHYANSIIRKTDFEEVIAIGVTGDEKNHSIQPCYVTNEEIRILEPVETFENFTIENIGSYCSHLIKGNKTQEEITAERLLKTAKELHEDLRNYGQLKEEEKPLVVSGLLIALEKNEKLPGIDLRGLRGSNNPRMRDGKKIYETIKEYIEESEIEPIQKKEMILTQFRFIKERSILNEVNPMLKDESNPNGMTPLKYFLNKIRKDVQEKIKNLTYFDVLGAFYSEFISYSAGDGKGLGIVITPSHVTRIFTELLEISVSDRVLDTCTGTAGFLVAAMKKMIDAAKGNEEVIKKIKREQLHGIELREDLYTIATTNMILRGDGKSNLICDDYRKISTGDTALIDANVVMLNPPYSQAKSKETRELSELNFIFGALNFLNVGGRGAAIVPQSVMIGKNNYDKELKKELLNQHTLEAVITMPKELFYPVGTNTVIAVFTAKQPHPQEKRVKFINFSDDGYKKHKTLGRIPTESSKDKEKYLLDVYFDRIDAPTNVIVKSAITFEDEWLHNHFYFNDRIPEPEDFLKTVQDYLAFKFDQTVHGRGYLFEGKEVDISKK